VSAGAANEADAARFWQHRERLFGVAYRMLGSAAEAEDVVQDAFLRWHGRAEAIEQDEAWLVTAVTRLCLDRLKSARHTRETYVGPWLPEPVPTGGDEPDPESISLAFLLVLERLTPSERAAWILRVVFDRGYGEVASVLGKSEVAVRQLVSRAKARLAEARPRFAPTPARHEELLLAFFGACYAGDVDALAALLAEDAEVITDGGGVVRAARNVVRGRRNVARLLIGLAGRGDGRFDSIEVRTVNGWPSVLAYRDGALVVLASIETDGELVRAVHSVLNPEKLRAFGAVRGAADA
jgi:RNA polymerase sigma-70 factor (ECF subfamily)